MRYRDLLIESRSAPLYHGSRLGSLLHILEGNALGHLRRADKMVSLSRSYQVALYFAESDSPYEAFGGVFVLDQAKLRQTFKIGPHHDPWVAGNPDHSGFADEQEEVVKGRIAPLRPYLLSINANPVMLRQAANNRAYLRDDSEINEHFDRRKRVVKLLIERLLADPLLNAWMPRFTSRTAPVLNQYAAARVHGRPIPGIMSDQEVENLLALYLDAIRDNDYGQEADAAYKKLLAAGHKDRIDAALNDL